MSDTIIAKVQGEPYRELPQNLYIPPHALEVVLDIFEGPLDFLLYLVKQQNIDILDIPIAMITQQYMNYINLMQATRFDLASEYLVMASVLTEIKSRMMLPKKPEIEEQEEDPRAELVRKLQLYEKGKQASEVLDKQWIVDRDVYIVQTAVDHLSLEKPTPTLQWESLAAALQNLIKRAEKHKPHQLATDRQLSLTDRIQRIRALLSQRYFVSFQDCFDDREGRQGLVVSFLAMLEVLRYDTVALVQARPLDPVYIRLTESGHE